MGHAKEFDEILKNLFALNNRIFSKCLHYKLNFVCRIMKIPAKRLKSIVLNFYF